MRSWLIQAKNLLNPAFFWIMGLGLLISVQLALICCLKRSGDTKQSSDHCSKDVKSSETKPTESKTTQTTTATRTSERGQKTSDTHRNQIPANPKPEPPSSEGLEQRRRSQGLIMKNQRRSSKKGVKQMIIEKSLKQKNISTNKASLPKNREPIKVKDGAKSVENDINTVKSTPSNAGKTKKDTIPSIDADQNQDDNNTGDKTAEIRREAAELKPTKVFGRTRNVKAKPGEYPTMEDVASDWGSAKEKKTKTTTKSGIGPDAQKNVPKKEEKEEKLEVKDEKKVEKVEKDDPIKDKRRKSKGSEELKKDSKLKKKTSTKKMEEKEEKEEKKQESSKAEEKKSDEKKEETEGKKEEDQAEEAPVIHEKNAQSVPDE